MHDYSHLEGKSIKFYDGVTWETGKVVGCDFDIGITIVNTENKDDYFCCLQGPSAPATKENEKLFSLKDHEIAFNQVVKCIKAGVLNSTELMNVLIESGDESIGDSPSAEKCAFNQ